MNYILMHKSTLNYLINQNCFDIKQHIGGSSNGESLKAWISGMEVRLSDYLKPTIMEPDYVFPYNKFIIYEQKDREWCEPLGIGRVGTKQVGEIYFITGNGVTKFFPTRQEKKKYYSAAEILYGIK